MLFFDNFKNRSLLTVPLKHSFSYPTPTNLNYLWSFGLLSLCFLIVQLLTGIFLAMHFSVHVDLAYELCFFSFFLDKKTGSYVRLPKYFLHRYMKELALGRYWIDGTLRDEDKFLQVFHDFLEKRFPSASMTEHSPASVAKDDKEEHSKVFFPYHHSVKDRAHYYLSSEEVNAYARESLEFADLHYRDSAQELHDASLALAVEGAYKALERKTYERVWTFLEVWYHRFRFFSKIILVIFVLQIIWYHFTTEDISTIIRSAGSFTDIVSFVENAWERGYAPRYNIIVDFPAFVFDTFVSIKANSALYKLLFDTGFYKMWHYDHYVNYFFLFDTNVNAWGFLKTLKHAFEIDRRTLEFFFLHDYAGSKETAGHWISKKQYINDLQRILKSTFFQINSCIPYAALSMFAEISTKTFVGVILFVFTHIGRIFLTSFILFYSCYGDELEEFLNEPNFQFFGKDSFLNFLDCLALVCLVYMFYKYLYYILLTDKRGRFFFEDLVQNEFFCQVERDLTVLFGARSTAVAERWTNLMEERFASYWHSSLGLYVPSMRNPDGRMVFPLYGVGEGQANPIYRLESYQEFNRHYEVKYVDPRDQEFYEDEDIEWQTEIWVEIADIHHYVPVGCEMAQLFVMQDQVTEFLHDNVWQVLDNVRIPSRGLFQYYCERYGQQLATDLVSKNSSFSFWKLSYAQQCYFLQYAEIPVVQNEQVINTYKEALEHYLKTEHANQTREKANLKFNNFAGFVDNNTKIIGPCTNSYLGLYQFFFSDTTVPIKFAFVTFILCLNTMCFIEHPLGLEAFNYKVYFPTLLLAYFWLLVLFIMILLIQSKPFGLFYRLFVNFFFVVVPIGLLIYYFVKLTPYPISLNIYLLADKYDLPAEVPKVFIAPEWEDFFKKFADFFSVDFNMFINNKLSDGTDEEIKKLSSEDVSYFKQNYAAFMDTVKVNGISSVIIEEPEVPVNHYYWTKLGQRYDLARPWIVSEVEDRCVAFVNFVETWEYIGKFFCILFLPAFIYFWVQPPVNYYARRGVLWLHRNYFVILSLSYSLDIVRHLTRNYIMQVPESGQFNSTYLFFSVYFLSLVLLFMPLVPAVVGGLYCLIYDRYARESRGFRAANQGSLFTYIRYGPFRYIPYYYFLFLVPLRFVFFTIRLVYFQGFNPGTGYARGWRHDFSDKVEAAVLEDHTLNEKSLYLYDSKSNYWHAFAHVIEKPEEERSFLSKVVGEEGYINYDSCVSLISWLYEKTLLRLYKFNEHYIKNKSASASFMDSDHFDQTDIAYFRAHNEFDKSLAEFPDGFLAGKPMSKPVSEHILGDKVHNFLMQRIFDSYSALSDHSVTFFTKPVGSADLAEFNLDYGQGYVLQRPHPLPTPEIDISFMVPIYLEWFLWIGIVTGVMLCLLDYFFPQETYEEHKQFLQDKEKIYDPGHKFGKYPYFKTRDPSKYLHLDPKILDKFVVGRFFIQPEDVSFFYDSRFIRIILQRYLGFTLAFLVIHGLNYYILPHLKNLKEFFYFFNPADYFFITPLVLFFLTFFILFVYLFFRFIPTRLAWMHPSVYFGQLDIFLNGFVVNTWGWYQWVLIEEQGMRTSAERFYDYCAEEFYVFLGRLVFRYKDFFFGFLFFTVPVSLFAFINFFLFSATISPVFNRHYWDSIRFLRYPQNIFYFINKRLPKELRYWLVYVPVDENITSNGLLRWFIRYINNFILPILRFTDPFNIYDVDSKSIHPIFAPDAYTHYLMFHMRRACLKSTPSRLVSRSIELKQYYASREWIWWWLRRQRHWFFREVLLCPKHYWRCKKPLPDPAIFLHDEDYFIFAPKDKKTDRLRVLYFANQTFQPDKQLELGVLVNKIDVNIRKMLAYATTHRWKDFVQFRQALKGGNKYMNNGSTFSLRKAAKNLWYVFWCPRDVKKYPRPSMPTKWDESPLSAFNRWSAWTSIRRMDQRKYVENPADPWRFGWGRAGWTKQYNHSMLSFKQINPGRRRVVRAVGSQRRHKKASEMGYKAYSPDQLLDVVLLRRDLRDLVSMRMQRFGVIHTFDPFVTMGRLYHDPVRALEPVLSEKSGVPGFSHFWSRRMSMRVFNECNRGQYRLGQTIWLSWMDKDIMEDVFVYRKPETKFFLARSLVPITSTTYAPLMMQFQSGLDIFPVAQLYPHKNIYYDTFVQKHSIPDHILQNPLIYSSNHPEHMFSHATTPFFIRHGIHDLAVFWDDFNQYYETRLERRLQFKRKPILHDIEYNQNIQHPLYTTLYRHPSFLVEAYPYGWVQSFDHRSTTRPVYRGLKQPLSQDWAYLEEIIASAAEARRHHDKLKQYQKLNVQRLRKEYFDEYIDNSFIFKGIRDLLRQLKKLHSFIQKGYKQFILRTKEHNLVVGSVLEFVTVLPFKILSYIFKTTYSTVCSFNEFLKKKIFKQWFPFKFRQRLRLKIVKWKLRFRYYYRTRIEETNGGTLLKIRRFKKLLRSVFQAIFTSLFDSTHLWRDEDEYALEEKRLKKQKETDLAKRNRRD